MTALDNGIQISDRRTRIRAIFDDLGVVLEGPIGTTIGEFVDQAKDYYKSDVPIIAAICNRELRELSYPLYVDSDLTPVSLKTSDGGRIYRRSLVMLMATAAEELWKGSRIEVRYAVPDGGFYCTREDARPFTEAELAQLEAHMRQIVTNDEPITKRTVTVEEAYETFLARQDDDKARLLSQRDREELVLYKLRGREDYSYGYMVRSTGVLSYFKLHWDSKGFILQYPRKEHPLDLLPLQPYDKLRVIFQQTEDWLTKMNVEDVGRLNSVTRQNNRIHELILVAEALHEQHIARIALQIAEKHNQKGLRLVLIAGPSSSGKTTFAKRLAIQLLAHGLRPVTIELDNYFVDRDKTPKDAAGDYDFEALAAINLPLFNEQLLALTSGKRVTTPKFDFLTGKSISGRQVQFGENQIGIIEGIHGLNPNLVSEVPPEKIFRVYVSALTQLNIDRNNRIPTTDVRLIRRIVRDAHHRGYSAADTLSRWQSVRRGEKNNIFPYQENSDAMFNSALAYELAALRPMAEPLLLQVKYGTREHIEAKRLLSFLAWVHPLLPEYLDYIPDTSLLREFIGKSTLQNYFPDHREISTEL
ncbi:MAG: hypothetical protein RLP44_13635 [Aggregatilineales bacterium]